MSPIPTQPSCRSLAARLQALEGREGAIPQSVRIARSSLAPDKLERLCFIEKRLAGDTTIAPRTTRGPS